MPQREDGACVFLSKDNLCEIYDTRPELCSVKKMYHKKIAAGKLSSDITEIDYYKMSTVACHAAIDHYHLDSKYKIDLKEYIEVNL